MSTLLHRKAWDVAGYTYAAENLCRCCTITSMIEHGIAAPAAHAMNVEDAIDQCANAMGIDHMDERSYDSGEFPKVIFVSMTEGDECDRCGYEL